MQITVSDGTFNAYVAHPDSLIPPAACVVVLHEIFGVNADIRSTCDELAARGFIAIAPELFWRDMPGLDLNSWSESDWKQGMDLYNAFDLDRGIQDVGATVEAAEVTATGSGAVGVIGFCLGGLMSYLSAARLPVAAAVAYYPGGAEQHLAKADAVASPLLVHMGDKDEFISPAAQIRIRQALSGKKDVEVFSYPGCSHAFARHTGTHYDAAAAELANFRTYAFLERHLR